MEQFILCILCRLLPQSTAIHMYVCRVSVSWGWGGGWLMQISRWKHMAGEQAHTVVMTTWQQLTPMHMPILSGEILPPRFNLGSDTFCLLFFIHTHTHVHVHPHPHIHTHTHMHTHTHITHHTLHVHNWTHICIERYIPYYISIRASNTAGYGETENKTAFTEEGSKMKRNSLYSEI